MISVKTIGSFKKTTDALLKMQRGDIYGSLDAHGARGVAELSQATPIDTSETANSWSYEIEKKKGSVRIIWSNTNDDGGPPVAVLIQYGHATRNGGFVEGRDFINPVMRPIFDQIATDVWREVTK